MVQIGVEAGAARATLYRHLPTHEALIRTLSQGSPGARRGAQASRHSSPSSGISAS